MPWFSPIAVLGVSATAMILQRFYIEHKPGSSSYDGVSDLMVHVHSPSGVDSASKWGARAFVSVLLSTFGGKVGPEGGAVEAAQAVAMAARPRSARWFEQRRRTDAACALSAGISAAFQAPFGAILVPIELGIGGRTVNSVVGALTAFLGVRALNSVLSGDQLIVRGVDLSGAVFGVPLGGLVIELQKGAAALAIAVVVGLLGALAIRFIRYSQDSLSDLLRTQAWMRTLMGGLLLFLVVWIYKSGHLPAPQLFEEAVLGRRSLPELGLLGVTGLLAMSLVLAAFGSIGIFWPIFALGSYAGFAMSDTLFAAIPGFTAIGAIAGAVALWGAMLGTPLAGALVAYEVSGEVGVLVPCLIAGLAAREIRSRLKVRALMFEDLLGRGIALIDGRSSAVLDSILVKDAMVADHETVQEQESVSEIHARLLKSRYPFLPVISQNGSYVGLLTIDMVQEAWRQQGPSSANMPLTKLLEAKDLLYRTGFKTPSVKPNDRLSVTAGMFNEIPCVPVVGDDKKVQGLLFVYHVRLAYDREVTRQAVTE